MPRPAPIISGFGLPRRVRVFLPSLGSSYDSRGTSATTHSAFISAASTNSKMSYADSQNQSPSITFTTASSSADTSSNVIESVLHSFVAESDPQQQITYEDFDQIGKLDLEELDIKWQMAMLSVRINRFEKKAGRKMKFNNRDAARTQGLVVCMIAGDDDDDDAGDASGDVSDVAAKFALMGLSSQVQAYKNTLQTLEQQKAWYQSNQLALEERIRILTADLENTTNMLKYTEKLNDQLKLEKLNDQVKLKESKARFDKWKESSKNLNKLINSSMSSRSKFGLGFGETFGSDEVFDPSAPSIFDTTPEDVEGKPLYNRFVKTDRMKAVPPPLSGNYIPLLDPTDLDESQMTYGPKQTLTSDSEPKISDLDSCKSNSSVESLESMPKLVIIEPKTSEYASCKSNLSAESPEFFPKSVCARNESVWKADNPRKNNKSPREDVENVLDEYANLIQNTKASGSSSFTAAAG
ncbi:hypothetical protein Tco_1431249 [Tanacetum coccineum]